MVRSKFIVLCSVSDNARGLSGSSTGDCCMANWRQMSVHTYIHVIEACN